MTKLGRMRLNLSNNKLEYESIEIIEESLISLVNLVDLYLIMT